MNPPSSRPSGALRIARVLGIDVWLHWTWAAVAFYEIESRLSTGTGNRVQLVK